MASDITKDAVYYRYQMKTICQMALNLKEAIDTTLDRMAADGVFYDGSVTGITADPEAANAEFALQQIQAALNTHKTNLNKGADYGNAISAPA